MKNKLTKAAILTLSILVTLTLCCSIILTQKTQALYTSKFDTNTPTWQYANVEQNFYLWNNLFGAMAIGTFTWGFLTVVIAMFQTNNTEDRSEQ